MTSAILINEPSIRDSGVSYRSRIQKLLDNSASFTARNILRERLNSAAGETRSRPFYRSVVTCAVKVNNQGFAHEPRVPRPMPYETLRSVESHLGRMSDRRLSVTDGDPSKKVRIVLDGQASPRVPSPESPNITFTFRVPKKTHHVEDTVNATIRVPSSSSSGSAPSTPWKESSVYTPPDFSKQYSSPSDFSRQSSTSSDFTRQNSVSSRLSKPTSQGCEPTGEASPKVTRADVDSSYTRPFDRQSVLRSSLGKTEPSSYARRSTRPQTVVGEPSVDRKNSAYGERPTFSVNLRSRPSDTPSPKKHCDRPSPRPVSMHDSFGRADSNVERSRTSPESKKGTGQTVFSERKFIFPRRRDSPNQENAPSRPDRSKVVADGVSSSCPDKTEQEKFCRSSENKEGLVGDQPSRLTASKMTNGTPPKLGNESLPRKASGSARTPLRDTGTSKVGSETAGEQFSQPSVPPRTRKPSPAKTFHPDVEGFTKTKPEPTLPQSEKKPNVSQIRIIPIEVLDKPHVRIIPIHIESDEKENRDRRSSTSSSSSRRAASAAPSRGGTVPEPPQRSKSYAMPSRASFRRSRRESRSAKLNFVIVIATCSIGSAFARRHSS